MWRQSRQSEQPAQSCGLQQVTLMLQQLKQSGLIQLENATASLASRAVASLHRQGVIDHDGDISALSVDDVSRLNRHVLTG